MKYFAVIALLFTLLACDKAQDTQITHPAEHFESSDECHVCGMLITRFGGPKGEAFETRTQKTRKFCSTMDLLVWYLQPENKPNVAEVYVHDMSKTTWDNPDDSALILANKAYFVVGSDLKGSMGKTVGTYSKQQDAQQVAQQHGGKVYAFDQLNIDLLLE